MNNNFKYKGICKEITANKKRINWMEKKNIEKSENGNIKNTLKTQVELLFCWDWCDFVPKITLKESIDN